MSTSLRRKLLRLINEEIFLLLQIPLSEEMMEDSKPSQLLYCLQHFVSDYDDQRIVHNIFLQCVPVQFNTIFASLEEETLMEIADNIADLMLT